MGPEDKLILAHNLRRLAPRPWAAFARRVGVNPKNFYGYLREKNPKTPRPPVLAGIASGLHISMDDLLRDGGPSPASHSIPIVGRVTAGDPGPDHPSAEIFRLDTSAGRVTLIFERLPRVDPPDGVSDTASAQSG